MELMVPLAVNNVNIAALYNCKPFDVAATVLVSTALFVGLLYFIFILSNILLSSFMWNYWNKFLSPRFDKS